jgi:glycosyltransferase involved in cell wall biosynthesis
MKITYFQAGARHNYFLPKALERLGLLQSFYTDLAFPLGGAQATLLNAFKSWPQAQTLSRRVLSDVPRHKVRTLYAGLHDPALWRDLRSGEFMFRDSIDWHIDRQDATQTNLVCTTFFDGGRTIDNFRPGTRLVSDVIIVPSYMRIGNVEADAFPEWGETRIPAARVEEHDAFVREMLDRSDGLLCPAQAVIDDIASYGEHYRAKCYLLPYGASLTFGGDAQPQLRRVLYAGAVVLRKGPQYLRQAADLVLRQDPEIEFVIAGAISDQARAAMAAPNITILGHLNRDAMRAEFARADAFVFPSLAEGSAGVVLEAMAAGLPIVTTKAAGVDIGPDAGIIIPERDPQAIADAVIQICNDRTLRSEMSQAARKRSQTYSLEIWATTYEAALLSIGKGK